jgi:hypothetical protein
MRVCGIELKANNLFLAVVEDNEYLDLPIKKIVLKDDEKQEDIREFCNEFLLFLEKYAIDKINIKKRSKKGTFAGGAVSFKMEALIQLNPKCNVELISTQFISKFEKNNEIKIPNKLNKYQINAYKCAILEID